MDTQLFDAPDDDKNNTHILQHTTCTAEWSKTHMIKIKNDVFAGDNDRNTLMEAVFPFQYRSALQPIVLQIMSVRQCQSQQHQGTYQHASL